MRRTKSPKALFSALLVTMFFMVFHVFILQKPQKDSDPDNYFFAFLLLILLGVAIFLITKDPKNKD
jgi:hypothetical protein